jgi:hypothetical protein
MNKSEVMDIISAKGGEALFHLSKKFLKDREIVIYALKNLRFFNEQSYSYKPFLSLLPKDKRKDREIVNLAVSFAASNYKYVHKDLQDDKYILVKAINNQRIYFDDWDKPVEEPIFHTSLRLQKDEKILGKAIYKSSRPSLLLKGMDHNKQLKVGMSYIKCLNSNYFSFGNNGHFSTVTKRNAHYVFNAFSDKIKLILEGIGQIGIEQFESLELNFKKLIQNDKETLIKLCSNFPETTLMFQKDFYKKKFDKETLELVLALITINPKCYKFIPLFYKKDESFVMSCIESNPMCLQYLAPKYKADEFMVLKAIKLNPESFKFAKKSIQKENLLPTIAAIPNLKSNFVLNDLLDADLSILSPIEKIKVYEFFSNRTDEKDIFILAKAKKRLLL